jgi:hypothetical protein
MENTRILLLVWFLILGIIAILLPILLRPTCPLVSPTTTATVPCCSVCPPGSLPVCGVGLSALSTLPILNNTTTSEIIGSTIFITGGNTITTKGELRFEEPSGSNYAGFKPPNLIGSSIVWTLPATDGTAGQFLQTDGLGSLGWATGSIANTTQSIFFNGSTLSNPAYVLLPVLEVSETSNGSAVLTWPTQFQNTGWRYNGSGQVILPNAAAAINNYIKWDNIVFGSTGIYSLRAYVSTTALTIVDYGIFQATVDGVPSGTTVNLSSPPQPLNLFDNIAITAGTHSVGLQCVTPGNNGGHGGQFLAEFFLLVQIS